MTLDDMLSYRTAAILRGQAKARRIRAEREAVARTKVNMTVLFDSNDQLTIEQWYLDMYGPRQVSFKIKAKAFIREMVIDGLHAALALQAERPIND